MRRMSFQSLLIVGVVAPMFAADPPKPLMSNVTVVSRSTAGFQIKDTGIFAGASLLPGAVCVEKTTSPLAISFDNAMADRGWRVRLLPPANAENSNCTTVMCARTRANLETMELCDRNKGAADECVTTPKILATCFGPECEALRSTCKLEGDPDNRTCRAKLADVLEICETKRCGVVKTVGADDASKPGLTSVNFPAETLGIQKEPYDFEIYDSLGTRHMLTVTTGSQGNGCLAAVREKTTMINVAVVPLDNVGVASWLYLNPRNPACLDCEDTGVPSLAFENRTSDRSFTVTIELPAEVSPAVSGCEIGKPCKISRTVTPNNSTIIDSEVLKLVPKKTLLVFQIGFADETERPSNPAAYLRISEKFDEPKPDLGTKITAKLGATFDPYVAPVPDKIKDANADFIDDETSFHLCYPVAADKYAKEAEPALCAGVGRVYNGKYARHHTGLARIDLSKNLGNRADISASVNYRTSDFGVDDGNQVKLAEYTVNIFGTNGLTMRFGRTTWANPANGIAVFEKGDGYRISYKYFSLGQLIKRESAKSAADPDNADNRSIIFQAKGVPLTTAQTANTPFLRGLKLLDFTGVRGEDKLDHTYKTAGAEVFYTYTNLGCGTIYEKEGSLENCKKNWGTIAGSLAAFQSSRHDTKRDATGPRRGRGWVGLLTTTWTPKTQTSTQGAGFEAVRSYTLQYGRGTSDDPDSTNTSEDYIGESGSFSGDTLLMSVFLAKVNAKGHTIIGPSLSNKTFLGLQFVSNTWSLNEYIAKALGVEKDVNSRSTTLRLREIRFGRPVYAETSSKEAVREISIDFAVEVPRGVRWTLGGGYMSTGAGLAPVIVDDAWVVTTAVSLTL